jgi:deoxycytidine triphosphate deaminase
MILSDRSIREELAAGRIQIDPLDEACIQPSSVDLHVDASFRVFAEGKSSLGGLGLLIHSTAGYETPGGTATSRSSCPTWRTCRSRSTPA